MAVDALVMSWEQFSNSVFTSNTVICALVAQDFGGRNISDSGCTDLAQENMVCQHRKYGDRRSMCAFGSAKLFFPVSNPFTFSSFNSLVIEARIMKHRGVADLVSPALRARKTSRGFHSYKYSRILSFLYLEWACVSHLGADLCLGNFFQVINFSASLLVFCCRFPFFIPKPVAKGQGPSHIGLCVSCKDVFGIDFCFWVKSLFIFLPEGLKAGHLAANVRWLLPTGFNSKSSNPTA